MGKNTATFASFVGSSAFLKARYLVQRYLWYSQSSIWQALAQYAADWQEEQNLAISILQIVHGVLEDLHQSTSAVIYFQKCCWNVASMTYMLFVVSCLKNKGREEDIP